LILGPFSLNSAVEPRFEGNFQPQKGAEGAKTEPRGWAFFLRLLRFLAAIWLVRNLVAVPPR